MTKSNPNEQNVELDIMAGISAVKMPSLHHKEHTNPT
jgi:hypothetical protein